MRRSVQLLAAAALAASTSCGSFDEAPGSGSQQPSTTASSSCNTSGIAKSFCSDEELAKSDATAPSAARVVTASDRDEETPFSPRCLTIRAGQTVTFMARFSSHPLIQREDSTLPNPIPTVQEGSSASVKFDCPGDYNFSCRTHQDNMEGSIRVVP